MLEGGKDCELEYRKLSSGACVRFNFTLHPSPLGFWGDLWESFLLLADKQAPQRNPFLSDRPATKQRPHQQTTGETFWDYARCGRGLVEIWAWGGDVALTDPSSKRITQGVALYKQTD